MLMDPLVSALNGSQTLISQGLRTLELCVDNLQPDFLYEHIQPVRAELMQVLCLFVCLLVCLFVVGLFVCWLYAMYSVTVCIQLSFTELCYLFLGTVEDTT